MIRVNNLNGSPEAVPTEFTSSHFDGDYFYFFESEEDRISFFASLPSAWSKEKHLADINALHEAEFDRRWRAADYVGRWEVSAAANDESNPYNSEAKAIMVYWWNGWDEIKSYGETVTEETAQTPEEFVATL